MRHLITEAGLSSHFTIDSAGTIDYHTGDRADARMRQHADTRGYSLDSIARQVCHADFEQFDLIIAMDQENHEDLLRRCPPEHAHKVQMLSHYLDGDWPTDVPDPYYGGTKGFEQVLDMIEAACPNILQSLMP